MSRKRSTAAGYRPHSRFSEQIGLEPSVSIAFRSSRDGATTLLSSLERDGWFFKVAYYQSS